MDEVPAGFCDQCGQVVDRTAHDGCDRRRALEPPRYCVVCGRRMVVQVTPGAWRATCSVHGVSAG